MIIFRRTGTVVVWMNVRRVKAVADHKVMLEAHAWSAWGIAGGLEEGAQRSHSADAGMRSNTSWSVGQSNYLPRTFTKQNSWKAPTPKQRATSKTFANSVRHVLKFRPSNHQMRRQTRKQLSELRTAAAKERETHVFCDIWNRVTDAPCTKPPLRRRSAAAKVIGQQYMELSPELQKVASPSDHRPMNLRMLSRCMDAGNAWSRSERRGALSTHLRLIVLGRPRDALTNSDGTPPSGDGAPHPTGGDTPPPRSPGYTAGPPPTVRTQRSFDPLPISEMRRYKRHLEPEFVLDAPTASARRSRTTSAASVIQTLMPKPADDPVEGAFWGAIVAAEEETADEDAVGEEIDAQINVPDPAMDVDATQRVERSYEQRLGLLNLLPFKDHHGHLQHPVGHMEEFIVHMNISCSGASNPNGNQERWIESVAMSLSLFLWI
ncbi:uncharacterized protein EV422DRAFT_508727 [Fimicolochytrium jonesii]|uniref:uncharacterized protein n=1 Tax=Fimicolochytrium jonesii TaxID=1396493 RepID=UPI0022FE76BA|nr:uncharacterized protein EV422DRAFT_508727 [Fimicolochytrium jonesii]KAI8817636.1 hypothetical protein EV422DRAFT_508727 [Fimicolochytrium jonesii]